MERLLARTLLEETGLLHRAPNPEVVRPPQAGSPLLLQGLPAGMPAAHQVLLLVVRLADLVRQAPAR